MGRRSTKWFFTLLGAAPQPLAAPAGFGWTPPVSVYRSGAGVYSTDFNADDWKIAATTDIYVSPTGNDTTGDGTLALPYRGIKKAFQVAAAGADVGYNIFVQAGEYLFGSSTQGTACDRNINVIAVGGRVRHTNKIAVASWTADGADTYKATRSGIVDVLDARYPVTRGNGEEMPELLTQVADVATCQATVSSWYSDDTTLWVHLQDGRSPDAGAAGDVSCIFGTAGMLISTGRSWFIQGIDFEGGTYGFKAQAGVGVTIPQVVMDDCTFIGQRGALDKAVNLLGVATGILNNVRAFDSEGDAFSASRRDASSPSGYLTELACHAEKCGRLATFTSIQNGSTNHADGRHLRVNCSYTTTYGPTVAEAGAAQSWNLGCSALDCLLSSADSQDSSWQAGNPTGDTCKMWLDGCTYGGAFHDLYAGTGSQILYRNMATPASIGGGGTIGAY